MRAPGKKARAAAQGLLPGFASSVVVHAAPVTAGPWDREIEEIVDDTLTLGIDEAGRGPILGPLVLACVGLRPEGAEALRSAGIVDSKRFGAGAKGHALRAALLPEILRVAVYARVAVVDVAEVDRRTRLGELNVLEQEQAVLLLSAGPVGGRIIADGERLFAPLKARYPRLESMNKAEDAHVSVAAASILAKTRRDEIWFKIAGRYAPEFGALVGGGSGYLNPATRRFLCAYQSRYGGPPPEGRVSWPWTFAED